MDRFRIHALHRLLKTATLQPENYRAAEATLLGKLDILINGAVKHRNQTLLDEFIPLRDSWCRHGYQVTQC
jgi:hypothetical protein